MTIINYPTFLQPATGGASGSGDIVGFNIQTGSAQSARYVSWGQAFEPGKVSRDATLVAKIGLGIVNAQMDVKTKHPDGSVRFAVITVQVPAIIAGGVMKGMLALGGTVAQHIPVLTALKKYNVTVALFGGVSATINIGAKLMEAIRAKTSSYWLRGELAVQARVDIPIISSLHLVADVTAYADGTFLTDLQFRNDYAFGPDGGPLNYGVSIFQNGMEVFNAASLTHRWAKVWRRQFHTKGAPTDDTHNVQHDIAYLAKVGALQNYDLTSGIDDASIDTFASTNIAPLSNPGWYYAMPSAGHRDDIGAMPGWYARWVKCQGWQAARTALAMANGAGSIPWHHFDKATNDYISLDKYPTLWIDDSNRGEFDLKPQVEDPDWYLDNAHAPDVAFVPYLMTGQRFYLDELTAQTSRQIAALWNAPREDGKGIAMVCTDALEVRAQVWTFRNLIEMAWAVPDNHPSRAYWRRLLDNNYDFLLDVMMPAWTKRAGEVAGYFYGVYGYTQQAPWQQDYAVSVVALAVGLRPINNSAALKIMKWASNYNVGRFTHQAQGFGLAAAVEYQLYISDNTTDYETRWYETWAKMAAANPRDDNLPQDGGDWVALGLMTLATIYNTTGNKQALTAYNSLKAKNAPGAAISDYQTRYPQFHIVPKT